MTNPRILMAASVAALLTLSACNTEPEVVGPADPQAAALKNAAPVELPPSIVANRTYRCADNSLAYVEFFNNNTANLRTAREGEATRLTSAGADAPYTAENASVSANAEIVQIRLPGKSQQRCHV